MHLSKAIAAALASATLAAAPLALASPPGKAVRIGNSHSMAQALARRLSHSGAQRAPGPRNRRSYRPDGPGLHTRNARPDRALTRRPNSVPPRPHGSAPEAGAHVRRRGRAPLSLPQRGSPGAPNHGRSRP